MRKDKIKCLYSDGKGGTFWIEKNGYVDEFECDCQLIEVGFYKYKEYPNPDRWIAVDIKTGLSICMTIGSRKQCVDDLKSVLLKKGYKTYKHCTKQAMIKYATAYSEAL